MNIFKKYLNKKRNKIFLKENCSKLPTFHLSSWSYSVFVHIILSPESEAGPGPERGVSEPAESSPPAPLAQARRWQSVHIRPARETQTLREIEKQNFWHYIFFNG